MLPLPSPTSYGAPARLGLDDHRLDRVVGRLQRADREGVKQRLRSGLENQLVGDDLVRRDVVGLRLDALLHRKVGLAQGFPALQALEHVVAHAADHAAVLAVHVGVQAAERRQPGRRAGAAEEAVALDEQRRAPGTAGGHRRGDAGWPAAHHHDVELSVHRRLAPRFADGLHVRVAPLCTGCTSRW